MQANDYIISLETNAMVSGIVMLGMKDFTPYIILHILSRCRGFDPRMELVRDGYNWPRAETYGDLLIAAGKRGVQVRLLVWYSYSGGKKQHHMPGYSHGTSPWRTQESDVELQKLSAKSSVQLIIEHPREQRHKKRWNASGDKLLAMAREEYCHSWYNAGNSRGGNMMAATVQNRKSRKLFSIGRH